MASFTVYNTQVTKDINRQQVVISISPGSRYIEQKNTQTLRRRNGVDDLSVLYLSLPAFYYRLPGSLWIMARRSPMIHRSLVSFGLCILTWLAYVTRHNSIVH